MIGPTAEDRARMTVRVLEQAIRESRSDSSTRMSSGRPGMSFKAWQDVAQIEISNAIRDAENEIHQTRKTGNRIAMVLAACLITIGFLGVAVSWGRVDRAIAAAAGLAAGVGLFMTAAEIPIRISWRKSRARRRAKKFENIRDLDKQIRRMEKFLEEKKKGLSDRIDAEAKAKR